MMTTTMHLFLGLCLALALLEGEARPFGLRPNAVSLTGRTNTINEVRILDPCLTSRGGASLVDDEYDEDVDESDVEESDDEEEEEVAPKSKLSSSAMKATAKAKAKKTSTAKKVVNAGLADSKPAVQTTKKSSMFRIPYILKACMNPFTVFAMTKAYFQSLVNLDYAKKEPSQDLRSALEVKAKKAATGGGARGRRKMKPGQAKTLSDLPQLNT